MAETRINKSQTDSTIYTQSTLIAGKDISITEVPQPIIDANTLGVWHFDGNTDNAISNSALSWNTSYGGNVVYESVFKKFGSSCAKLSTRSTSQQPVFTGDTQTFMTGDWTWDFWIFVNSGATPGSNTIVWSVGYAATNTYSICVSATDVRLQQNGPSVVSDIATSTWHHIAFVKEGVNLYRFFNGKLIDTTEVNPSDMRRIYRYCGTDTARSNTFFDEMRVSDAARWTEDFTPFSLPYSEGGDTIYRINDTKDISGKQDLLSTATGYDASATQVLKNVNGVLTWVDEA